MSNIKDAYLALQKKLNLPDWSVVDFEFEVSLLDHESFLLRGIRQRIFERAQLLTDILIDVLQPDTASFASMYECNFFSQEEKEKIMDLYKRIMVLLRSLNVADLKQDDKFDAEVIGLAVKAWPAIRDEASVIVQKLRKGWSETEEVKELLGYLG